MTKSKEMRIKDVGATINLGNYSTLHVTVGESAEYEGLELQRATSYLRSIAEKVGGILNLPDEMAGGKKAKNIAKIANPIGVENKAYGSNIPVLYEHTTHSYTMQDGTPLTSVTQFLSKYYPMNANIAREYMDFAASFGNLVHTAVQNAVIGKPPKKALVKSIVDDVMAEIGDFDKADVEQFIVSPEDKLAGRFDIVTTKDNKNTLWDVKTNTDLFLVLECDLPEDVKEFLLDVWNPETTFGEHCLQLNLYAYMLEKSGVEIDEIKIIHIPDGFDKIHPVEKIDMAKFLEMLG